MDSLISKNMKHVEIEHLSNCFRTIGTHINPFSLQEQWQLSPSLTLAWVGGALACRERRKTGSLVWFKNNNW